MKISNFKIHYGNFLTLLLILIASIARSGKIVESDIFWQTRAGLDFLASGKIISQDIWSYSPLGEWIPNSWLWNVLLGIAFKTSSEWGLFAFGFCVSFILLAIIAMAARKLHAKWEYINVFLCLLIAFSFPVLTARPHIFDAIAMCLLLFLVPQIVDSVFKWPFRSALVFFCLNALAINLHFSWPASLAGVFIGIAAYTNSLHGLQRSFYLCSILAISAILGILLNPLGIHLFEHALSTANSSTPVILEWQPVWKQPLYIPAILLAFASLFLSRKNPQLFIWAMPATLFACLGIFAIRFAPWALVLATPVLAAKMSTLKFPQAWQKRQRAYLSIAVLAFCASFAPSFYSALKLHGLPENLSGINALPTHCHLFASPVHSGAIPLYRPDILISIDGRNDYWGLARYSFALETLKNPSLDSLEQSKATCFIALSDSPLAFFFAAHTEDFTNLHRGLATEVWTKK